MTTLRHAILACIVLLAACADTSGPVDGDPVDASFGPAGVVAHNRTHAPVYWFAVEQNAAMTLLWLWAPCVDPARCPSIAPRGSATIDFDDIVAWQPDSESAILYHWHIVRGDNGGLRADSIRSLVVSR